MRSGTAIVTRHSIDMGGKCLTSFHLNTEDVSRVQRHHCSGILEMQQDRRGVCVAPGLERRFSSVAKPASVRRIYLIDQGSDPHNLNPVQLNGSYPNNSNAVTLSNSVTVHLLSLNLACCCSENTSGDMLSDTALIPDIDCRTTSVPRVHCSAYDFAIYFHPIRTGAIEVLVFARPWQFVLRQKGKSTASIGPYRPI